MNAMVKRETMPNITHKKICCLPSCTSTRATGLSTFRFPSTGAIREKWIEFINIKNYTPLRSHRLCSLHFNKNDINISRDGKRVTLFKNAVPAMRNPNTNPIQTNHSLPENPTTMDIDIYLDASSVDTVVQVQNYSNTLQSCTPINTSTNDQNPTSSNSDTVVQVQNYSNTLQSCTPINTSTNDQNSTSSNSIAVCTTPTRTNSSSVIETTPKIPKFVGLIRTPHVATPRRAKAVVNHMKRMLNKKNSIIKVLRRRNVRLQNRLKKVTQLLRHLERKTLISEKARIKLMDNMPVYVSELMTRAQGHGKEKYSPVLRTFALTLKYYSTKAYKYVRRVWRNLLPAPSTIRKWYQQIDGAPGFTKESLTAIKLFAEKHGRRIPINVVLDEMSIRQEVLYKNGKTYGYVDLGTNFCQDEDDGLPKAKSVLVFMAVALNAGWKVPVGYFLVDALTGKEQANLLKICLEILSDSEADVHSICFDGLRSNVTMVEHLGANFNSDCFKPYILDPKTKRKIRIIFDPSHMIKLVRNTLGNKECMEDSEAEL